MARYTKPKSSQPADDLEADASDTDELDPDDLDPDDPDILIGMGAPALAAGVGRVLHVGGRKLCSRCAGNGCEACHMTGWHGGYIVPSCCD